MLEQIVYFSIFGKPLIFYGGIVTFLMLLVTASILILNRFGIRFLNYNWHKKFGYITILFAFIHGILALLNYF